jgi:hypothetical protein
MQCKENLKTRTLLEDNNSRGVVVDSAKQALGKNLGGIAEVCN